MIRLAVILTLLTAITAGAWTQEMLMGAAYARRGASASSGPIPITSGLIGAWLINGGTSTNTFPDSSGLGTVFTNHQGNSVYVSSNSAFYFDGSSSIKAAQYNTAISNLTTFTYAVACKIASADMSGFKTLIGFERSVTDTGFRATLNNDVINLVIQGVASVDADPAGRYPTDGAFHTLIFSYDSSRVVRFYRDGVFLTNKTTSATQMFKPSKVMYHGLDYGTTARWKGQLANSQLFNRVLTDAEVTTLHNAIIQGKK